MLSQRLCYAYARHHCVSTANPARQLCDNDAKVKLRSRYDSVANAREGTATALQHKSKHSESTAKAQRKHSDQFVATLTFEHSKRIFWPPRQCCINVHKRCDICNRVAYTERLYCKSIAIWCDVLENSVATLSQARWDWGIMRYDSVKCPLAIESSVLQYRL